mgnify:CR=1 FL=1
MGEAQRWLEGVTVQESGTGLEEPLAALSRAMIELGDAQDGVERVLGSLEFNPGELEDCEERLFAIRALARKHDVQADELGDYAETLRGKLAALDAGDQDLADQEAALKAAEAAYTEAAQQLSAVRRESAAALDQAVMTELAPLKMERAVFETRMSEAEPGPEGIDTVAFTVATNPGAPAGALNKIASGGELSRFLLALKVVLADRVGRSETLAMVRLRNKPPGAPQSGAPQPGTAKRRGEDPAVEWETAFPVSQVKDELASATDSFRLAAGVALFAELLRGSVEVETMSYADVYQLLDGAYDPRDALEVQLMALVQQAAVLSGEEVARR